MGKKKKRKPPNPCDRLPNRGRVKTRALKGNDLNATCLGEPHKKKKMQGLRSLGGNAQLLERIVLCNAPFTSRKRKKKKITGNPTFARRQRVRGVIGKSWGGATKRFSKVS